MWIQDKPANSEVLGRAAYCLGMTSDIFDAPGYAYCAHDAWEVAEFKHFDSDLPDVAVPIWFDMWADLFGEYRNWGHVAAWIPGKGILNVPASNTPGQKWFATIEECARWNGATYVGWSEDLQGWRIAHFADVPPEPVKRKKKNMLLVTFDNFTYLVGAGFVSVSPNKASTDALTALYEGNRVIQRSESWAALCRANGIPKGVPTRLKDSLGAVSNPCWSEAKGFFDSGKAV